MFFRRLRLRKAGLPDERSPNRISPPPLVGDRRSFSVLARKAGARRKVLDLFGASVLLPLWDPRSGGIFPAHLFTHGGQRRGMSLFPFLPQDFSEGFAVTPEDTNIQFAIVLVEIL